MTNEKLTCYLIDDDKISLRIMRSLVEKTEFLHLAGVFDDPLEAFKSLSNQNIDILFLDVEMPEMSGLELLEALEHKPQIILTTSKAQYAVDAFDYEVADFLLKPIDNYARFLQAVQKARAYFDKKVKVPENKVINNHIFIKVDSLLVNLNLDHILWIEASGDYIKIHTSYKIFIVHTKIKTVEELLPAKDFVRVHRSYLVRIDKIKNIDNTNLQIEHKIVPISNSYRNMLLKRIMTLS